MSKIKEGEYVRTIFGKILQITSPRDMGYIEKGNPYFRQQIKKHSPNIIDLIEVGDYVNGKLIHYVLENSKNGETMVLYGNGKHIDNKHIKSIVTKEQFEEMEYKVDE